MQKGVKTANFTTLMCLLRLRWHILRVNQHSILKPMPMGERHFMWAAREGRLGEMTKILSEGASVNAQDRSRRRKR